MCMKLYLILCIAVLWQVASAAYISSSVTVQKRQDTNKFDITFDEFQAALSDNDFAFKKDHETMYHQIFRHLVSNADRIGGISSKRELAMFLAHAFFQTEGLSSFKEYGCPGHPHCESYGYPHIRSITCGPRQDEPCPMMPYQNQTYYGRGFLILPWVTYYASASWSLYGDDRLYKNPVMVEENQLIALDYAMWYWRTHVHVNQMVRDGWFGVSTDILNGQYECDLDRPGQAPRDQFSRHNHGGLNSRSKSFIHLAQRRWKIYQTIARALNLHEGLIETGCYN